MSDIKMNLHDTSGNNEFDDYEDVYEYEYEREREREEEYEEYIEEINNKYENYFDKRERKQNKIHKYNSKNIIEHELK